MCRDIFLSLYSASGRLNSYRARGLEGIGSIRLKKPILFLFMFILNVSGTKER